MGEVEERSFDPYCTEIRQIDKKVIDPYLKKVGGCVYRDKSATMVGFYECELKNIRKEKIECVFRSHR